MLFKAAEFSGALMVPTTVLMLMRTNA